MSLSDAQIAQLRQLPFRVYSPSRGGGSAWAELIRAGLVEVTDVGDDQETILQVSATPAGRALLSHPDLSKGGEE